MLEAHIDTCTTDGFLEGWAHLEGSNLPAIIEVSAQGKIIAKAVADEYRWDLLSAKIGHGHYGFRARLKVTLEPGEHVLQIREARTGLTPQNGTEFLVKIPQTSRKESQRTTVEELMMRRVEWTDSDAMENADALKMEKSCAHMGSERFVDVTYMFTLGRRADPDGLKRYAAALDSGELGAPDVFRILMQCDERRSIPSRLSAPFSEGYPYLM